MQGALCICRGYAGKGLGYAGRPKSYAGSPKSYAGMCRQFEIICRESQIICRHVENHMQGVPNHMHAVQYMNPRMKHMMCEYSLLSFSVFFSIFLKKIVFKNSFLKIIFLRFFTCSKTFKNGIKTFSIFWYSCQGDTETLFRPMLLACPNGVFLWSISWTSNSSSLRTVSYSVQVYSPLPSGNREKKAEQISSITAPNTG